ncbi:MFS general substrate transporter [Dacryopinax primogenitus]|uniref:MFS general substrate transporter n=1 Tax=Dacryopinax primogenitus (strain DJM 731) TaxID=1858805 RepID=M5FTQ7_DACPD|nr:MFS general substrate transporter [Dacryopinax primogenitus]EJU01036.1 MFS general substrate transporter [Dacryopinax primogenitus]
MTIVSLAGKQSDEEISYDMETLAEVIAPAAAERMEEAKAGIVPEKHDHEHHIPEGGVKAWMTVAGAWWISSICFGYANAFGVYQTYYVTELLPSYSTSAISWIGSLQAFFLYSTAIVAGPMFDRGYCRHMLVAGSVLFVGCLFAQAQAQRDAYYQIFLSQGLGQGMAMGMLYLPGMAVVLQHFKKNSAVAIGIAFTGSSIGGIVFPIMINNIFNDVGYVWGVRAAGFYVLGATVFANLLIRPQYAPKHTQQPAPNIATFLKDPPYICAVAGAACVAFGLFFVYFYIQLYTLTRGGISQNFSFYTLAIVNGASIFGRTIPNIFADKIGITKVLMPMSFLSGALVFVMFGLHNVGGITIFCILYGFITGAYVSMSGPFFAAMADHMGEMGARMGLALALVGIAALVGTPIDGALLGNGPEYSWSRAIVFTSVMMIGGTCIMTVGAWLLAKKRGKWV